jgi:hypothetical protein
MRRCLKMFLDAVNMAPELDIELPETLEELEELAAGFNELSDMDGLFYGIIGALDGWLCTHNQPRFEANPGDYYSGHNQRFGTNVQALCDHKLRFRYVAVASPGKTNDVQALRKCVRFCRWLENIGQRYNRKFFIIGDNAYELSDNCLIPYSGKTLPRELFNFNFFLSQLRIRVEMAFGRLSTKWRIFRRDTDYEMSQLKLIIQAATRLHNFVIDVDGQHETDPDFILPIRQGPRGLGYIPSDPIEENTENVEIGNSARREFLVRALQQHGLARPVANLERNAY